MKKPNYEEILIKEYKGDLGRIAVRVWCYEIGDIERGHETNLTFTKMLRNYLFNRIVNVKDPASPSSLLDPEIAVLMSDILKEYKKDFDPSSCFIDNLVAETNKVVERLDYLINNIESKKSVAKEELSDITTLCKIINRQCDSRRPSIGMGISAHCPPP